MKLQHLIIVALAASAALSPSARAAMPTCYNRGSLGATGNGTHVGNVLVYQSGAVAVGPDYSSYYDGTGPRTTIPWQAALNPASASPFTIEFWAKPEGSDNDDCPLFNRVSAGNRSGWAFFQRDAATGWNWRMYDGNGSEVGWNLTGGTANLDEWSHVVGVWNGTTATLYVNGADTAAPNTGPGGYNASTAATFSVGAYDDGSTPSKGFVDEVFLPLGIDSFPDPGPLQRRRHSCPRHLLPLPGAGRRRGALSGPEPASELDRLQCRNPGHRRQWRQSPRHPH